MRRRPALALLALVAAAAPAAGSWRVRCDAASGEVTAVEGPAASGEILLADGFPGPSTARAWIEENCPSTRCTAQGECATSPEPARAGASETAGAPEGAAPAGGGWEAGEVVDLAGGRAAPSRSSSPPPGPLPPAAADLSVLVSTARAAADACRYDAAQAVAAQMAEFDPAHPFLAANGEKLRELVARQKRTESAVWRAAQLLEQQDFEKARGVAREAAASSLGCQTVAVSQLASGIEQADARLRAERSIENRRAAAALLVPLIALANTLQSEGTAVAPGGVPALPAAAGAAASGGAAPAHRCAFDYAYPSKWSVEPICRCAGWRFEARQFRCVPGPAGSP